jgi:hypothetical protein
MNWKYGKQLSVLMIENIVVATSSFLAPLPSHGNMVRNALLLAPPLKQNIDIVNLWKNKYSREEI